MHLLHIPQYTIQNRNVHISVLNGVLWDMKQVHCGVCEIAYWMIITMIKILATLEAGFQNLWRMFHLFSSPQYNLIQANTPGTPYKIYGSCLAINLSDIKHDRKYERSLK